MKNRFILAQLVFVLVIITAAVLAADPEAPVSFDLSWHTIDAGGGECFGGGNIELHGTIGQPDAGVALTGGAFELVGGFWPGTIEQATTCPTDIFGDDGLVNIDDLLLVISDWGRGVGAPGDVDHNGSVDIDDLLLIIGDWGTCP
jgi:hypothetical protein